MEEQLDLTFPVPVDPADNPAGPAHFRSGTVDEHGYWSGGNAVTPVPNLPGSLPYSDLGPNPGIRFPLKVVKRPGRPFVFIRVYCDDAKFLWLWADTWDVSSAQALHQLLTTFPRPCPAPDAPA